MKQKKLILVLALYAVVGLSVFFSSQRVVFAATAVASTAKTDAQRCADFKKQFESADNEDVKLTSEIPTDYCSAGTLLYKAMLLLLSLAGGITVLFIIFGGYLFLTAAGNEEQTEKGKKTLTNSIIGLVVIILAVTIVRILVNTITGGGSISTPNTSNTPSTQTQTQTQTPSTPAPNSSTAPKDLVSVANPPESVQHGTSVQFQATVSSSNAAALVKICGVDSITSVPLNAINSENDSIESKTFEKNSDGSYTATLQQSTSEFKDVNKFDYVLYVCDANAPANAVRSGSIELTNTFAPVTP